MIDEGSIDEAEVHYSGRPSEMQIVTIAPAAKAIGALEEFIADAGAPFGSKWRDIGNFLKMEMSGVVTEDDHGESVFKAERLGDFEMKAIGVELLDAVVDGGRIALRSFVEHGGEGRACVFNVEVKLAGLKSFVDEKRAAQVGLANDGDAGAGFDVLGEKFGKNNLFGEKFGADGDFGLRRPRACGEEVKEVKKVKEAKESEEGAAHVTKPLAFVREGRGENQRGGQGQRREWRRRGSASR